MFLDLPITFYPSAAFLSGHWPANIDHAGPEGGDGLVFLALCFVPWLSQSIASPWKQVQPFVLLLLWVNQCSPPPPLFGIKAGGGLITGTDRGPCGGLGGRDQASSPAAPQCGRCPVHTGYTVTHKCPRPAPTPSAPYPQRQLLATWGGFLSRGQPASPALLLWCDLEGKAFDLSRPCLLRHWGSLELGRK